MKSSKRMVPLPCLSNFLKMTSIIPSDNRYPKDVRAVLISFLSIFPELSLSKDLKQFCQSVTYFHKELKSSKVIRPWLLLSNIPEIAECIKFSNIIIMMKLLKLFFQILFTTWKISNLVKKISNLSITKNIFNNIKYINTEENW